MIVPRITAPWMIAPYIIAPGQLPPWRIAPRRISLPGKLPPRHEISSKKIAPTQAIPIKEHYELTENYALPTSTIIKESFY